MCCGDEVENNDNRLTFGQLGFRNENDGHNVFAPVCKNVETGRYEMYEIVKYFSKISPYAEI